MEYTREDYKRFDYHAHYLEKKISIVRGYNATHGTNLEFYTEFINFLYKSGCSLREIGETVGETYAAIGYQLKKMGVTMRRRGGARNKYHINPVVFLEIVHAVGTYKYIGGVFGYSAPLIGRIKTGKRI